MREHSRANDLACRHEITVVDFVYQFLMFTILPEAELFRSHTTLTLLIQEAMVSRSPNLYLLMIQLVDKFCAKAGMNSESRPRKDFVDTVYRLVDHCLKIANDHRATISRFDLEEKKSSPSLDEKTAARIRSLSLKTIHTLAEIVPTLYGYLSDDKSRAASNVISTVMSYLRDRSEHNLPWAGVSSMFLVNLLEQGYTTKTLKKEILDIFYDNNFFYMDYVALDKWCRIINHIMSADKTAYHDLLSMSSSFSFSSTPGRSFTHAAWDRNGGEESAITCHDGVCG